MSVGQEYSLKLGRCQMDALLQHKFKILGKSFGICSFSRGIILHRLTGEKDASQGSYGIHLVFHSFFQENPADFPKESLSLLIQSFIYILVFPQQLQMGQSRSHGNRVAA